MRSERNEIAGIDHDGPARRSKRALDDATVMALQDDRAVGRADVDQQRASPTANDDGDDGC